MITVSLKDVVTGGVFGPVYIGRFWHGWPSVSDNHACAVSGFHLPGG
jgi:hypothetical protein